MQDLEALSVQDRDHVPKVGLCNTEVVDQTLVGVEPGAAHQKVAVPNVDPLHALCREVETQQATWLRVGRDVRIETSNRVRTPAAPAAAAIRVQLRRVYPRASSPCLRRHPGRHTTLQRRINKDGFLHVRLPFCLLTLIEQDQAKVVEDVGIVWIDL